MLIDILLALGKAGFVRYKVLSGKDGTTSGVFITIDPAHKDNVPLLAHERTHVGQFWLAAIVSGAIIATACAILNLNYALILPSFFAHFLLNMFCRPYHRYVVLTAHRAQLKFEPDPLAVADFFARHITKHYNTGLTYNQALNAITKGYNNGTQ